MNAESWLTLAPVALSAVTYAAMMSACAVGVVRARRARGEAPARTPRVTILKPLAGSDDDLEDNLASFAMLDYPDYEVLLGVSSRLDPAVALARRFVAANPERARLVFTDPENAVNPKVAQLIDLDRKATGEVLVVSDSNVRVEGDYLWSLLRELERPTVPAVGLVTSIFVGSGEQSMGAALENLQLGAVTAPGIVATNLLTPWPLTIGKSMAMRRRDLAQLGGFGRFGGLLAEDQAMGQAFLEAGMGIRTSLDVVHNRNSSCSVRRTLERHTRWAKLRRSLSPAGFLLEPLLSPLWTATAVAIVAPSQLTLAIGGVVAVLQTVIAVAVMKLLRGRALAWRHAPLEIVRTYLLFGCWAAACCSTRIQWRGHPFVLKRGSVIVPAPPTLWATLRARVRSAAARA